MINFPSTAGAPTDGSFTHTENELTWYWDGITWRGAGSGGGIRSLTAKVETLETRLAALEAA